MPLHTDQDDLTEEEKEQIRMENRYSIDDEVTVPSYTSSVDTFLELVKQHK